MLCPLAPVDGVEERGGVLQPEVVLAGPAIPVELKEKKIRFVNILGHSAVQTLLF